MVDFSSFFTYHTISRGERGDDGLSAYQKNTFYLNLFLLAVTFVPWHEEKIK